MTTPFDQSINPTTDAGRKLWDMATRGLDDKFNGEASKSNEFLASLADRAALCMWDSIINFTQDNGEVKDLINHHAMIPLDKVVGAATTRTFIVAAPPTPADFPDDEDPDALVALAMIAYNAEFQLELKSKMLYHFLLNSIEGALKTHISQKITQGLIKRDGPTCLKYIRIKLGGRGNKQAVRNARSSLQGLNLKEHRYDIGKFHEYINEQVLIIESNGSQVSEEDLIATLMDQYKKTTNADFLSMIRTVENTAEDDNIEPDRHDLMTKAETKYDTLVKRKEWNRTDPRDAQILALEARVEAIHKKNAQPTSSTDLPKRKQDPTTKKPARQRGEYAPWMIVPPAPGTPSTLTKSVQVKGQPKNVKHYWCKPHRGGLGLWVQHTSAECKMQQDPATERATLQARLSVLDNAASTSTPSLEASDPADSSDDE